MAAKGVQLPFQTANIASATSHMKEEARVQSAPIEA